MRYHPLGLERLREGAARAKRNRILMVVVMVAVAALFLGGTTKWL